MSINRGNAEVFLLTWNIQEPLKKLDRKVHITEFKKQLAEY